MEELKWVYAEGAVAFGDSYVAAARQAVSDRDDIDSAAKSRIINGVAREQTPEYEDVALGVIWAGRPQIWLSNVDRSHVFSVVLNEYRSRGFQITEIGQ